MRSNPLKQLWGKDLPAYGVWNDLGSPGATEGMAQLGPDWILLDCEHGVATIESCFTLLQAMNGSSPASVIRVPALDRISVKRSLDMGAECVFVPYIKSAAEVEMIVSWCRYPPTGVRGVGPFRASKWETDFKDYYERANDEIAVIVQIETVEALENLDAILAVKGLDAIFIGPADLSATMGYFPNMRHPEVQRAVDHILAQSRKAGKPCGYYCNSGREARERADQGFRMMNIGNDMVMLNNAILTELNSARGVTGAKLEAHS